MWNFRISTLPPPWHVVILAKDAITSLKLNGLKHSRKKESL